MCPENQLSHTPQCASRALPLASLGCGLVQPICPHISAHPQFPVVSGSPRTETTGLLVSRFYGTDTPFRSSAQIGLQVEMFPCPGKDPWLLSPGSALHCLEGTQSNSCGSASLSHVVCMGTITELNRTHTHLQATAQQLILIPSEATWITCTNLDFVGSMNDGHQHNFLWKFGLCDISMVSSGRRER